MPDDAHGDQRARTGFAMLVGLLVMIAAGKAILADTLDPDLFWHLRVAEQLRTDGIGPLVDRISFASTREPWTPYSWLAQLGMKAIWDLGGFRAAIATHALMSAGIIILMAMASLEGSAPAESSSRCAAPALHETCTTVMPSAARHLGWPMHFGCWRSLAALGMTFSGQPRSSRAPILQSHTRYFNCAIATALGAYLTLKYLSFRPATAAIFILAFVAWLLLRDRRLGECSKAVWLAIPLTALLVNIHLTAAFVPVFAGCLMLGAMWERNATSARRYAVLMGATSLACLATPMLPGLVRTVWHYQFSDVMVAGPVIAEMRPIYHGLDGLITCTLLAGLLVVALMNRQRVRVGEWLWLAFGAGLMLRLGRFSPVFALIAAPMLAVTLPTMSDRVLTRRPVIAAMALVLLVGAFQIVTGFPGRHVEMSAWLNRHGPDTPGYPSAATDFIESNIRPKTGRLVTEFTWGGYAAWRLGSQYQILLDGRTQLYSRGFWRSTYLGDERTRRQTLAGFNCDAAIVPAQNSVFKNALESLGWTTVYRDDRAEVMVPPSGAVAGVND